MPRTQRSSSLEKRSNRLGLATNKYHFVPVDEGVQLGYRRGARKSTWVVRIYAGNKRYRMRTLGLVDDYRDADGKNILTFFQAAALARERSRDADDCPIAPRGGHTVDDAVSIYLTKLEGEGKKSVNETKRVIEKDIVPEWGAVRLLDVTATRVNSWRAQLLKSPGKTRGGREREFDDSPEGQRRRRATAQRKWNVLRAILNVAAREGWADRRSWAGIADLKNLDPPEDDFPTLAECRRLARRATKEFRPFVEATFLCGAAYSELCALRVRDYTATGHVRVFNSKRKARYIPLTSDGIALFDELTSGKHDDALVFTHKDERPWGKSEQHRPMQEANKKAKIDPPVTLTRLRKAYGSLLLNAGVPLLTVSRAMGHHDQRVTARHYARLLQATIDEQVRAALPSLGGPRRKVAKLK